MLKAVTTFLLAAIIATGLHAAPAVADDASDIQAVISSQLQAFRDGDGAEAYGYAAPNVTRIFPSPEVFMAMVKSGYAPVFSSSNAVFGGMKSEGSGFRQEVFLTDADGQSWIASYTLERQLDGSMKITGCSIRKGQDVAA